MKGNFSGLLTLLFITLFVFASHPALPISAAGMDRLTGNCGSSYVVRAGDTLSAIAARCGVSLRALLAANGLRLTSIIYPGQRLTIPGSTISTFTPQGAPGFAPTYTYTGCSNPYIVRPGDTLSLIARRCSVSVYALKQWNGLRSDLIWAGQALFLRTTTAPAPAPAAIATPSYTYATPVGTSLATPTPASASASAPVIAPAIVEYPALLPTPTPAIESPISPWW